MLLLKNCICLVFTEIYGNRWEIMIFWNLVYIILNGNLPSGSLHIFFKLIFKYF